MHSFDSKRVFDLPLGHNCSAEYFRYGQWVHGAHQCGLAARYYHSLHDPLQRAPRDSQSGNWCWQAHGCRAEAFSIRRFCEKLNGRRILIVGDSVQHQFYVALFKQLNLRGNPLEQWYVNAVHKPDSSGHVCHKMGGGRLEYMRNDQISVGDANTVRWNLILPEKPVTNRNWAAVIDHFDILVLNKGAHYLPKNVSTAMTADTIKVLQSFLQQDPSPTKRRRHVFYRTTPQGSPHCSASSQVNTSLLLTEPYWLPGLRSNHSRDVQRYVLEYNWDKFPQMNNVTVSLMTSGLPKEQFTVLHVAEMTSLRADGHRCPVQSSAGGDSNSQGCDELHYYLPSVVDSWVYVFFNLLKPF